MRSIILCFLFALLPWSLSARKALPPEEEQKIDWPWFTGPLLTPSAVVVTAGHFNIEPYIYITVDTGNYTSDWKTQKIAKLWQNSFQPFIQFGLTNWLDLTISPSFSYNYRQGQAKWTFDDFPAQFGIQLYTPSHPEKDWIPFIRLSFKETFPTGKYRNLDPRKLGTDIGGAGTFNTTLGLTFGKLFYFGGIYFIASRLSLQYSLPSPIRLKGFNAYGGGIGTNARFFPAQNFQASLGLEGTLTKNWALALDVVGNWWGKTHFSGQRGVGPNQQPASLGSGSAVQYSLAPAIEYNWNTNLGVIGGIQFTVAGRNATQFYSGIFALNYYQ